MDADDVKKAVARTTPAPAAVSRVLSPSPAVSAPLMPAVYRGPLLSVVHSGVAIWVEKFAEYAQFVLLLRLVPGASYGITFESSRSAILSVDFALDADETSELARRWRVTGELYAQIQRLEKAVPADV